MSFMPVLRSVSQALWIIIVWLICGGYTVEAQERKQESAKILLKSTISGVYNDNLIIGTETRSPIEPIADQILVYSFDTGLSLRLITNHQLTGLYRFYKEDQKRTGFLRRTDQTLSAELQGQMENLFGYVINGAYQLFDFMELSSLNFNQTNVEVKAYYMFPFGLMLEAGYFYVKKDFTEDDNNVTGYSLVSSTQQKLDVRIKKWLSERLRLSLRYYFGNQLYDPTPSTYLNNLSGLLPQESRNDDFFAIQPELLFLPWQNRLLLNVGFQIEDNQSNSDYYNFTGLKALADVVFELYPNHTLTVESSFGVYDYSERQFDTRFKNTKEDFRTTLFVTYEWIISKLLTVELNYHFMQNDSNDSFDYNPFTSRTYSSFTQNFFRSSLHLDLSGFF